MGIGPFRGLLAGFETENYHADVSSQDQPYRYRNIITLASYLPGLGSAVGFWRFVSTLSTKGMSLALRVGHCIRAVVEFTSLFGPILLLIDAVVTAVRETFLAVQRSNEEARFVKLAYEAGYSHPSKMPTPK
jgi:hypothetical protein